MNEMLEFVKAMSDPKRLQMIGFLSQNQATPSEIAKRLKLPASETLRHLSYLEQVGAVTQIQDVYVLNHDKLATIARDSLTETRLTYMPNESLDEKTKKILKAHLNPDGSIREIPAPPKLKIILDYLIDLFELDKNYTEKEVNTILKKYNEDTAGLRRDLIDANMLARESDGSRYWRCPEPLEERTK